MNGRQSAYMLGAGGAFLLVMLGTRMSTLSFGQVFSPHREEDATKIAQLTAKVDQLQAENRGLSDQAAKVSALEAESQALRADIEALKAKPAEVRVVEKPVYVARSASPVDSTPVRRKSRSAPTSPSTIEPAASIVHRGDGPGVVRSVFGKPLSVQEFGSEEWWLYNESSTKRVVFKGGVVTEWSGMDIEP